MAQQQIKGPPHSGGAECRNRYLVGPVATGCRLAGGEGDRGEETVPGGASEGAWHTVDPGPAVSGMVGQKTSTRTIWLEVLSRKMHAYGILGMRKANA